MHDCLAPFRGVANNLLAAGEEKDLRVVELGPWLDPLGAPCLGEPPWVANGCLQVLTRLLALERGERQPPAARTRMNRL